MSAFGKAFVEMVVGPWQKQCSNAPFPWMATPELRKQWLDSIASKDPIIALASAIGLARCANPNIDEFKAVNQFFADTPENITSDIVVLDLLLTGATPPVILAETFFLPNMTAKPLPTPLFWPLLATYLRHPANVGVAKAILEAEAMPSIATYNALANPSLPFPEKYPESTWYNALKIFHSSTQHPSETAMKNEIERFAFFMRCDFSKDDFLQASRDMLLEDPFLFAQLHHPCAFSGACPTYTPTNPSAEALKYFAHDYPICSLYRFYNPLLNYPWLSEDIASPEDDGIFMGLLLMGGVPLQIDSHHVADKKKLISVIREHPAWEINILTSFMEKISDLPAEQQIALTEVIASGTPPPPPAA